MITYPRKTLLYFLTNFCVCSKVLIWKWPMKINDCQWTAIIENHWMDVQVYENLTPSSGIIFSILNFFNFKLYICDGHIETFWTQTAFDIWPQDCDASDCIYAIGRAVPNSLMCFSFGVSILWSHLASTFSPHFTPTGPRGVNVPLPGHPEQNWSLVLVPFWGSLSSTLKI